MNETQTKKKSYKEVMDELLEQFKDGSLPDAVARSYTAFPDVPCSKYSLTNRVLILSEHTNDARGYKQWQSVGRQVKKGKKAFYIFTPKIKIVKKKDESKKTLDNGQQKEKEKKCTGFRLIPMFRYEDTEGSEIPEHIRPATLPPLIDVAEKAGIEVNWSKTEHGEYGYFSPKYNSISLACDNPTVFFHELVHAYDNKNTQLKNGQDPVKNALQNLVPVC